MQSEIKQGIKAVGCGIPLSIIVLIIILIFIREFNSNNDVENNVDSGFKRSDFSNSGINKVNNDSTSKKAKIDILSHSVKKVYGNTSIVGEVQNNGSSSVSFVKVTATFYDTNGKVVDTSFTYAGDTANTPLSPGKKSPFEIGLIGNTPFNTYKLDVDWN